MGFVAAAVTTTSTTPASTTAAPTIHGWGRVAGKTGTAETGVTNVNTTWFAAFAPADAPRIAIAVVVENQRGGCGGSVSAPIAKEVMESLLC